MASARTVALAADPAVLTVVGDIADPATAGRIAGAALERFGRIDTLVNDAGVYIGKPFTDCTAEDYSLVVGVNLAGFFWLTRRVIAEMLKRDGGHVVNIAMALADRADARVPSVLAPATDPGRPAGLVVTGRPRARGPGRPAYPPLSPAMPPRTRG